MVCLSGVEETGVASKSVSLKTFFLVVAGVCLIEAVAFAAWRGAPGGPLAWIGCVRGLEIACMLWIVTRNGELGQTGLSRGALGSGGFRGLLWSGIFAAGALVGYAALKAAGTDPLPWIRVKLPSARMDRWLFFLVGGIISPLAEELFFRSVVYGFFRRWGVAVALSISVGLFALAHGDPGAFYIPQIVGGTVFAWSYERSGSLVTPFVIHALGNLCVFGLSASMAP